MEKLYYTIGEVSELLGEPVSLVRYWSNTYSSFFNLRRNGKGNRLYTSEDIETLKQIHFLVKDKGLTLEGAARHMSDDRAAVEARVKVLDSLKKIREQLMEIKIEL